MNSRTVAFGLLVVGALAMLITAGLPWYDAGHDVTFNGNDLSGGLAQALAAAVLAGTLLMLTVRATGRRIVAALLVLISVAAASTFLQRPSTAEALAEVRKRTLTDAVSLTVTGGSYAYLASCAMVLAGAVLVLVRAGHWPQRAGRFERGTPEADSGKTGTAAGQQAVTADPDDPAAIWKAIDAGEDPTDRADADEPRPDNSDRREPHA